MIPDDILARIPGCGEGCPPTAVVQLSAGGGNRVLHVVTPVGQFVLRQRHSPLDRPGSTALMELRSHGLAAAAGLAPRVLASRPDGAWLLMEFIAEPSWSEAQLLSPLGAARLGARLGELHALPVPSDLPSFDALGTALAYQEQIRAFDVLAAQQFAPQLTRIRDISQQLQDIGMPAVLNHGDLVAGNLLGHAPQFIDWEYAQIVDPTYDLACLLTYYPRLESQRDLLVSAAGLTSRASGVALALQQERFASLNALWNVVHGVKAG